MTWYNPFSSKNDTTEKTDPVLISGDNIVGLRASETIEQRQLVTIDDDFVASPTDSWDRLFGVALYDATEGEELAAASYGTEINIWAGGEIRAGDRLTPTDTLSVETDNSKMPMLVALEGAKKDELVQVRISGK